MTEAIVVDMDGTLADVAGIRHYVTDDLKNRDFEKFHGAASLVPPNRWVVDKVNEFGKAGAIVIVVTGRSERWRYRTVQWLRKWDVCFDFVFMRTNGDERPDVEVKRNILHAIRANGFHVQLAIDDNPSILALWNQEGIETLRVPGWS